MSQDEAVHKMRGAGNPVITKCLPGFDGKEHNFRIIREIINVPSVEAKVIDSANQIGYISLNQFGSRSAVEIKESLNDLLEDKKVGALFWICVIMAGRFRCFY